MTAQQCPSREEYEACCRSASHPAFTQIPNMNVIPLPAPAYGAPGWMEYYFAVNHAKVAVYHYELAMQQWGLTETYLRNYYAAQGIEI